MVTIEKCLNYELNSKKKILEGLKICKRQLFK